MITDDIVGLTRSVFGGRLTGIYLHGSAAFGCLNPNKSDIDFIVVINSPASVKEKTEYIAGLAALETRADCPAKGVEMSVVPEEHCREFVYPTPFELHYSAAHRKRFLGDPESYCRDMRGTDKDLAAHFTVIRAVGRVLYVKPISEVFGEVRREYFLDSIMYDVGGSLRDIVSDPVYFVLNLCRAAAFVREGAVLSKADGAEWAAEKLLAKYAPLINAAAESYRGSDPFPEEFTAELLKEFAERMLAEITAANEGEIPNIKEITR